VTAGLKGPAVFWLIVIAAFFAGLYLFSEILLPFVAGMAVAYLFDPVCDRLERAGLSRTLATSVVTLVFVAVLAIALLLVLPVVVGQVTSLVARLPDYLEALRGRLGEVIATLESRLSPDLIAQIRQSLGESGGKIAGWITNILTGVVTGGVALANLLSLIFITPVVSFYLLRDWDRIVAWVDGRLPRASVGVVREQTALIDRTLAGWVRGQFSVCLVLGIYYAAGLTLAGLDFGLVIGLLAGLLSFIPFVGAAIGLVSSVGVAFVQFDDWIRIAIVAAIFFAGQAIEGNFLTPRLVGDRVGLHPVWVIFALLAGGTLFGFVGVLLAVPVAATLGVLARFLLQRYLESDVYGEERAPPEPADDGPAT
jgi:predicted PurR-regulated permease PerM